MSLPRRILIVRPSHLGDIVCALPVFHALRTAAPEARIGWVVQPEFAGLLANLQGLDAVFAFGRKRGVAAWLRLFRELREFAADVAVDAQGNAKSAGAMLASGAPRRIGLARANWREPIASFAVNEPAPPVPNGAHAVERMFALARHAARAISGSPELDDAPLRTDPALDAGELSLGEVLADRHLPRGAATVIVHLAAPNDIRAWPVDHYRSLAEQLLARGRGVLLLSGPGERPIGEHLRAKMGTRPGLRHWVGQRHLREACAFFAASARRGARLVSGDSGPMHVAAACGLPVVTLCGPQDPALTGPWPPPRASGGLEPRRSADSPHVAVRADDPPECAPCLARRCVHHRGPVCMADIRPAAVADVLTRVHSSGGV